MKRFEGTGHTFEEAMQQAVSKIPPREGTDFVSGLVVDSGAQIGGLTRQLVYFVIVEEELEPPIRTMSGN